MKKNQTIALSMALAGVLLALAGPFLPGGIHLKPSSPPGAGHITVLTTTTAGDVLAGTQDGAIWRLHGGLWTQERIHLGGNPVMAILGEPGRAPIGTAGGLYNAPVDAPPLETRVSSLLQTTQGLLAGTADGVRLLANGRWEEPGPEANVYSLFRQQLEGADWLHAGTVGGGVLSTPADETAAPWQTNDAGLPQGTNAFSFAQTKSGALLVGTDKGLFWQSQPGASWTLLHPELADRRILALYLAPGEGADGTERLWIGGDDGLAWQDFSETAEGLSPIGSPMAADSPEYQPPVGISWIVSDGDKLMLSAGSIYEYGPTALAGWYWVSIVGLVLILLAAWWMPQRPPALPGAATSDNAS